MRVQFFVLWSLEIVELRKAKKSQFLFSVRLHHIWWHDGQNVYIWFTVL